MYHFKVRYLENDNDHVEYGISAGTSYEEALKNIISWYSGSNDSYIVSIDEFYELNTIIGPWEMKEIFGEVS